MKNCIKGSDLNFYNQSDNFTIIPASRVLFIPPNCSSSNNCSICKSNFTRQWMPTTSTTRIYCSESAILEELHRPSEMVLPNINANSTDCHVHQLPVITHVRLIERFKIITSEHWKLIVNFGSFTSSTCQQCTVTEVCQSYQLSSCEIIH